MKKEQIIQLFSSRADPPEHCYRRAEEDLLYAHIRKYFGAPRRLLREAYPQGVRADIALIEPSEGRAYRTLITVGMGAFVMDVPEDLADCELERAELMMCLPSSWSFSRFGAERNWPLDWLRILAHIPVEKDLWLGWGHIVPTEGPVSGKAAFSCMLLTDPLDYEEAASYCEMPDGSVVNIYQVLPIFEDEMKYRQEKGTDALLTLLEERLDRYSLRVVDVKRRSGLAR
jgi:hypothetical protein